MTAVDFISHLITEHDSKDQRGGINHPERCYRTLKHIQQVVHDIRNTHSFMLMTINRCVDYTKASVGIQLVPKCDTINLLDTLKIPLNIMKNLQEKVTIELSPMSEDISKFIKTDGQWLQENLLCLLSNAVKYTKGNSSLVKLSIQMVKVSIKELKDYKRPQMDLGHNNDEIKSNRSNRSISLRSTQIYPAMVSSASNINRSFNHDDSDAYLDRTIKINEQQLSKDTTRSMLLFEVEDEGIGLSESVRTTLFSTEHASAKRQSGGVGLGLYSFAKRIEALKGDYGVKARSDGKSGSLFWFSIPYVPELDVERKQDRDAITATLKANGKNDSITKIINFVDDDQEQDHTFHSHDHQQPSETSDHLSVVSASSFFPSISASLPPGASEKKPLRILIAEDALSIAKMMKMMLTKHGHDVSLAENGQVALDLVEKRMSEANDELAFDVILTDIQMPVMDGYELTRRIRKLEQSLHHSDKQDKANLGSIVRSISKPFSFSKANDNGNSPSKPKKVESTSCSKYLQSINLQHIIIGVSANSDNETAETAFGSGVNAFIQKPFTMACFYSTLQNIQEQKQS